MSDTLAKVGVDHKIRTYNTASELLMIVLSVGVPYQAGGLNDGVCYRT